jgi:leucyl-tRNA synthetase
VPGHDERDFEFAKKFDLPIVEVVQPPKGEKGLSDGVCFTGEGTSVDSGPITGLATSAAQKRATAILEEKSVGRARTTYKLRDWLFSRQRYWGEPFPLLHLEDGSVVAVPDDALPVTLPQMDDFKPATDGSAPLARVQSWVETTDPATGKKARRDTDTMPGWAGSCWYWLRFMDPHNERAPFSKEAEKYWGPVDLYVGGAAHAVMHLLYARFWHKVFFDLGFVSTKEPFQRLFNQGMITAFAYEDATQRLVPSADVEPRGDGFVRKQDGAPVKQITTKMAKSLGNVVNPDDVIAEHGADAFRLYELFMGPLADSKPWNTRDIPGCRRFVERVWRLYVDEKTDDPLRPTLALDQQAEARDGDNLELEKHLNRALARVDDSFRQLNLNTAIAAMMELLNEVQPRVSALDRGQATRFVAMLAPFAPHLAEELWQRLGLSGSVHQSRWPEVDARFLEDDVVELPVQVQGKLRGRVKVAKDAAQDDVIATAKLEVASWLEGKTIVKTIVVPGKLVNFVVR